jgi:hypothetical protein
MISYYCRPNLHSSPAIIISKLALKPIKIAMQSCSDHSSNGKNLEKNA